MDYIIERFNDKVDSVAKKTDQIVIEIINKMIKDLDNLKSQYLAKDRIFFALSDENKRVFGLLEKGPASKLKPEDIYNCVDTMSNSVALEQEQNKKIESLRLIMYDIFKKHEYGLERIRLCWRQETNQAFKFSNQLCDTR